MRVLQGYGVGAVQDDPAENTDAEFVDARRAGGQGEVREVRQAARAILSCTAERRAGVYEGLLKTPPGVNRRASVMAPSMSSPTYELLRSLPRRASALLIAP